MAVSRSLPQDVILFQILTRVPINSVIRFKCVSKQWNSFLMSDRFKEMHNRNNLKDRHLKDQKIFLFSDPAATFFTIDCESLPKAPCVRYLPKFEASDREYMCMLTSFHGLVCLGVTKNNPGYSDFILWNPLTNEYKRLSKPSNPDHTECYKCSGRGYGLYYSSCEDDYKLLVLTESGNVYIYSLKSDSWRKLNKKAPFQEGPHYWGMPGLFWKKNLYFLVLDTAGTSIWFDTTAERFHKIETPPEYDFTNKQYLATTTVHRGSIHVCVEYDIRRNGVLNSTCLDLWKLNADGDIWSKVVTYQLMPNCDIYSLDPLHLMSNGNWLMSNPLDGGRICQVDLKKMNHTKDKEDHKSIGKNKREGNCHDEYDLYLSDVKVGYSVPVRYTETFVSPNQYKK